MLLPCKSTDLCARTQKTDPRDPPPRGDDKDASVLCKRQEPSGANKNAGMRARVGGKATVRTRIVPGGGEDVPERLKTGVTSDHFYGRHAKGVAPLWEKAPDKD